MTSFSFKSIYNYTKFSLIFLYIIIFTAFKTYSVGGIDVHFNIPNSVKGDLRPQDECSKVTEKFIDDVISEQQRSPLYSQNIQLWDVKLKRLYIL
jgi:hypothetical protein